MKNTIQLAWLAELAELRERATLACEATQVERQFDEAALQGVGLPNHAASEVVDCVDFAGEIAPSRRPIL